MMAFVSGLVVALTGGCALAIEEGRAGKVLGQRNVLRGVVERMIFTYTYYHELH